MDEKRVFMRMHVFIFWWSIDHELYFIKILVLLHMQ